MLTPGVATLGTVGRHSVVVAATDASGGTPPYTYQWQWSWVRRGGWNDANGIGTTTLSAVIKNLGPGARYGIRLAQTDATSTTVFSNTVEASTRPLVWPWWNALKGGW